MDEQSRRLEHHLPKRKKNYRSVQQVSFTGKPSCTGLIAYNRQSPWTKTIVKWYMLFSCVITGVAIGNYYFPATASVTPMLEPT